MYRKIITGFNFNVYESDNELIKETYEGSILTIEVMPQ